MIVVAGTIVVAPEDRDQYLHAGHDAILATRSEPGCLAYYNSADSIDPGIVHLFEIWENEEDLDRHLAIRRSSPPLEGRPTPLARNTVRYFISASRPNSPKPST